MKFLHTADLHIGKIVNDFSMLEDQKYILEQIKDIALANKVDGVLLAGDIYDRAIPTGEAVVLFDAFLTALSEAGMFVFLISGNHDSPERLSFGETMLARQRIGIGGVYKDKLPVFEMKDEWGCVEIVLLPFVKPAQADARTSQEAVTKLLKGYWEGEDKKPHEKKRRVLVTHFFVTDAGKEPELSDSETTVHVGGIDNVDVAAFEGFDYVALGHIHKPWQIGNKPVYYAGSPLKYSFGEVDQTKSVLIAELSGEGLTGVTACPLRPLREMRKVKGTLQGLLENAGERGRGDYIQAILTDQEEIVDPIGALRSVYPNIMQIVREEREEKAESTKSTVMIRKKEPAALFEEFYRTVRGEDMTEEKKKIILNIMKNID